MGRTSIDVGAECKWLADSSSHWEVGAEQSGSQCYWCEEGMLVVTSTRFCRYWSTGGKPRPHQ